ncbi:glycosyltransferase family 2 protein [Streptomyces yunnanensis]|uniref:Dolichol-phosphate mannosyltransferase n=1 Tax=Streptomyces yunnanensis TaxID=156453 RepID=A0A9X8QQQ0_9ACTN|nr:glycosyltransferase family 2 protein [Streptomyces yunnanensis]SHL40704.1 dolichol-phosphate mannosyltransferase [Streptomyces yunnanensis]
MATPVPHEGPPRPYLVSIVLPCFNEEEVLERTHQRLSRAVRDLPHEIVYVDDGSTDRTWQLIEKLTGETPTARAVRFSRNFGHQAACLAGLREADGDAVVLIDADLQDPPELIPRMVEQWLKGWSVVSARRSHRQGETVFKKATAYTYYRLLASLTQQPVALDTGDFRLLDRKVVDFVGNLGESELFLRGAISWTGFPETSIRYERDARGGGETKYTLRKMLALSRSGLLAGGAALPLRLPTYLGVASLAAAVGVGVARQDPRRSAQLGAFGVQSLVCGVLGEYLISVFRQVQGRPPYLVLERIRSTARPTDPAPKLVEEYA